MDEVDMVFVGADGVVESGCIINMMGTRQISLVAKSMNKLQGIWKMISFILY